MSDQIGKYWATLAMLCQPPRECVVGISGERTVQ